MAQLASDTQFVEVLLNICICFGLYNGYLLLFYESDVALELLFEISVLYPQLLDLF